MVMYQEANVTLTNTQLSNLEHAAKERQDNIKIK